MTWFLLADFSAICKLSSGLQEIWTRSPPELPEGLPNLIYGTTEEDISEIQKENLNKETHI